MVCGARRPAGARGSALAKDGPASRISDHFEQKFTTWLKHNNRRIRTELNCVAATSAILFKLFVYTCTLQCTHI